MDPSLVTTFDFVYKLPITPWGDLRTPPELKQLAAELGHHGRSLELGCGLGRFSRYLAQHGFDATGIDFSAVAIAKAKKRVARDASPPDFQVGDVTRLDALRGPYDLAFDVGCFHCLNADGQAGYAASVARLLRPGAQLLIWGMDRTPPGGVEHLTPEVVRTAFASTNLELARAEPSSRRFTRSHWYWLRRQP